MMFFCLLSALIVFFTIWAFDPFYYPVSHSTPGL